MFERSLKLSLHIPKRFNAFKVLKWFLLLFEVTCVIFARATNTNVCRAIVARATKSRKKTVVSHLNFHVAYDQLKTNMHTNFRSEWVPSLGSVIDYV